MHIYYRFIYQFLCVIFVKKSTSDAYELKSCAICKCFSLCWIRWSSKAVNNVVKRWTLSDILCNVNGSKKDLLVLTTKDPPPSFEKKIYIIIYIVRDDELWKRRTIIKKWMYKLITYYMYMYSFYRFCHVQNVWNWWYEADSNRTGLWF